MTTGRRGIGLILTTFLAALVLTLVPLPDWGRLLRPEWTLLVLTYWAMATPDRVGVGIAWLLGLFQDVAVGTLLGQHALTFALVTYVVLRLHPRLRIYPLWQQAVSLLVLVALHLLVTRWIMGFTGYAPETLWFWAPAATSAVLWPLIFVFLRRLRRRYRIA